MKSVTFKFCAVLSCNRRVFDSSHDLCSKCATLSSDRVEVVNEKYRKENKSYLEKLAKKKRLEAAAAEREALLARKNLEKKRKARAKKKALKAKELEQRRKAQAKAEARAAKELEKKQSGKLSFTNGARRKVRPKPTMTNCLINSVFGG